MNTEEKSFNERIGRRIRDVRRHRKVRQLHLAPQIGVHRNTLMRWETGESPVDAYHLVAICDALGVDLGLMLMTHDARFQFALKGVPRKEVQRAA